MRHTILIATLSSVAASVLTTVVISGSLFGAGTASSANTPVTSEGAISPGGVEGLIQGDVDCGKNVTPVDSLKVLRHDAGLSVQQAEPCPDIGTVIPVGEGVPGPQGPQGEQGPPGEQGPAGVNLFADVTASGVLENGTAVSALKESTGVYIVTFGQNISDCTAVATPGSHDGGFIATRARSYTYIYDDSDSLQNVEVAFLKDDPVNPTGNLPIPVDTDFHLIVVC